MTCELNTNSLRILTVVFGDPNRLTALRNNYLAEPYSCTAANALVDFQRLRKETPSYDLYSYGFGNYPIKNKLHSSTVEQMTRTSEYKQTETKDVRLLIDLKSTLGRANGTIRKSNVRLANLTAGTVIVPKHSVMKK